MRNQKIEQDIQRLDSGIRQLKVQYDMFFAGALAIEPTKLRQELELLIRRQSHDPRGNYVDKFRMNALISRFNSFAELWGKTVRNMEEGEHRTQGAAERAGIRERLVARCRISDVSESEADLRRLHTRYVDTNRRLDQNKRTISFEKFRQGVAAQTERLRRESGCGQIELRLTLRDDKVQLKARPGR